MGPYQFKIVGTLRPYSMIDRLGNVKVPTLVIHSPQDEVHDVAMQPFLKHIRHCELKELRNSTHLPMFEEPDL